jgi:hypothetical protein
MNRTDSDAPAVEAGATEAGLMLHPDFAGDGGASHSPLLLHVFPFAQQAPPQQNWLSPTHPCGGSCEQQIIPAPTQLFPQQLSPAPVLQPFPAAQHVVPAG